MLGMLTVSSCVKSGQFISNSEFKVSQPTNIGQKCIHDISMTVFIAKKTGFGAEVGTLKFVRIWLPSSL